MAGGSVRCAGGQTWPLRVSRFPMADTFPDGLRPIDVGAVHHVAINVRDLKRSIDFYARVLGLNPVRRTGFRQVLARGAVAVHLFQAPEPATAEAARNWRQIGLQHVAFMTPDADLDAIKDRLMHHGVDTDGPVTDADGRGLYLRDPDGIVIELRAPPEGPVREAPAPRSPP